MFSRLFPNEAFPNEAKAPGPYLRVSFPRVQRTICISFPLVSQDERACDAASLLLAGGALERAGFATRHEPGAAQRAFETWRTDKSRM